MINYQQIHSFMVRTINDYKSFGYLDYLIFECILLLNFLEENNLLEHIKDDKN